MIVRIRLFAAARELVDDSTAQLEVPEPASVAQLRASLVARYPALHELEQHLLFAVDEELVADDFLLRPRQEVACFPPVSGG